MSGRRRRCLGRLRRRVRLRAARRQVDLERAPLADRARHRHEPAVIGDDALNGRQTEACATARFLGCEKGIEDSVDHLLRHSLAGVGHFKHRVGASRGRAVQRCLGVGQRLVPWRDEEVPAARHGVARIDAQVEQHLSQLRRIARY